MAGCLAHEVIRDRPDGLQSRYLCKAPRTLDASRVVTGAAALPCVLRLDNWLIQQETNLSGTAPGSWRSACRCVRQPTRSNATACSPRRAHFFRELRVVTGMDVHTLFLGISVRLRLPQRQRSLVQAGQNQ